MALSCGCACRGATLDRMLQPAAMALLWNEPCHGYVLIERLSNSPLLKGKRPDPTGVYRLLNKLQKQGLVQPVVESSSDGPDKRLYELTDLGRECAGHWVKTLEQYREDLGQLIETMHQLMAAAPVAVASSQHTGAESDA